MLLSVGLRKTGFAVVVLVVVMLFSSMSVAAQDFEPGPKISVLQIEGTITRGTTTYLRQGLEQALQNDVAMVVFVINTPGGLVDATLDIMEDVLNSPIPIITYVAPRGAIAASAGAFILLSGHVAAMSPGTTTGAAMPIIVNPSDGSSQPADQKTINFLAGHMRSIASTRNRPADIAASFVTDNVAISDQEALSAGVVDEIADSLDSLLAQIDGTTVDVLGVPVVLNTTNAQLTDLSMTMQQKLINLISNPEIAFMLFLVGFYGIIFGINAPGTFIPEIVGAICLVLALLGLGMFAVNTTGIVLMVLSVAFFIAELLTPTFGVLTLAGVISMVLGALLLPYEPLLPLEWFLTFRRTVLGMAAVTGGFLVLVVTKLIPLRKIPAVQSQKGMLGYTGTTMDNLDPNGYVKIRGEIWKARALNLETIPAGEKVIVQDVDGMTLLVTRDDLSP